MYRRTPLVYRGINRKPRGGTGVTSKHEMQLDKDLITLWEGQLEVLRNVVSHQIEARDLKIRKGKYLQAKPGPGPLVLRTVVVPVVKSISDLRVHPLAD